MAGWNGPLEKIDETRFRIPKEYKPEMRVDGIIYADEGLLESVKADMAPEQVANVATLPGIVGYSLAMPDIHWGYGFAIGGVAAFTVSNGIISPGGVGYDINCGVRLLRTNLERKDLKPELLEKLVRAIFHNVPSGVGSKGKIRISRDTVAQVLSRGARWAVEQGYGTPDDLEYTEEHGEMAGADLTGVSAWALERGMPQLGTLGAGNHFLEIQEVVEVYDPKAAAGLDIQLGQITVMIHTGSRGLGYQICDDNVKSMIAAARKYGIQLVDRQLACAPLNSEEGRRYFGAMVAAANYAWANRQAITHWVREAFATVLGLPPEKLGMSLIYDVAHNIAKIEEHEINGRKVQLCVHRKGATRAFPPGHPALPQKYRHLGQPVLIPGDMGTNSYLLLGTELAMKNTFGSACHGAGRVWSRKRALQETKRRDVEAELRAKGILVMAASRDVLNEEVPDAYKDVDRVVEVCHRAGIALKVAKMKPLGVVKG
jgi:tRNA-splicing ligase RtcB|uniref:tRNA-splicing ligase RtcB n=1 Tax=candidate division WOR-3 bacterium TaxID=2052148 RepID=A0A7V3UZD0_UNCW3